MTVKAVGVSFCLVCADELLARFVDTEPFRGVQDEGSGIEGGASQKIGARVQMRCYLSVDFNAVDLVLLNKMSVSMSVSKGRRRSKQRGVFTGQLTEASELALARWSHPAWYSTQSSP